MPSVFSKPKYNGACTYLIVAPTLTPYVGQTVEFRTRMNVHKSNGKNACTNHEKWKAGERDKVCAISFAINKYGWENMRVIILEQYPEWTKQLLDDREKHFISFFDSFKNGYNCNEGGGGNSGYTHTEEAKAKMVGIGARPVTSCLIKQEYPDGTQLVEFVLYASAHDAEAKTGVAQQTISNCCNKKAKSAGGRYWFFSDENHPPQIRLVGTMRVPRIGDVPMPGNEQRKKAIFSVSPAGEKQLHESAHAAERNLSTPDKKFDQSCISACCSNKRKTHHGYTFSFATPEQVAEFNKNTKKRKRDIREYFN